MTIADISPPVEQGSAYPFQLGLIPPGLEAEHRLDPDAQANMPQIETDFDTVFNFLDGRRVRLGHEIAQLTEFGHYNYEPLPEPGAKPLYVVRTILVEADTFQRSTHGRVAHLEADCLITPYDNVAHAETHRRPQAFPDKEFDVRPFTDINLARFGLLRRVAQVVTERGLRK